MHYLLLLRDYKAVFLSYCCFYFFYDSLLICKYEPFLHEVMRDDQNNEMHFVYISVYCFLGKYVY